MNWHRQWVSQPRSRNSKFSGTIICCPDSRQRWMKLASTIHQQYGNNSTSSLYRQKHKILETPCPGYETHPCPGYETHMKLISRTIPCPGQDSSLSPLHKIILLLSPLFIRLYYYYYFIIIIIIIKSLLTWCKVFIQILNWSILYTCDNW